MDKNPKDIFSSRNKDWWNNACLNFLGKEGSWTLYSMGYKRAADILVQNIESTKRFQDSLVFPIIFLYRHYLELIIKEISMNCAKILEEEDIKLKRHNLLNYWKIVKVKVPKILNEEMPHDYVDSIENVLNQLEEIDKESVAFRYPCHKDGKPTLPGIKHINIKQFSEELAKVSDCLEGMNLATGVILDQRREYKSAMRDYRGF